MGRGQGAYVINSTPVLNSTGMPGPVNQALDPIYEADDVQTSSAPTNGTMGAQLSLLNYRDIYIEASGAQTTSSSPFSCNGSNGGTGWGTLANRPTTCTSGCAANNPGCAYFATDQLPAPGILYVWKSGAWAVQWEAYTYPHPLDGGVAPSPPAPAAIMMAGEAIQSGSLKAGGQ